MNTPLISTRRRTLGKSGLIDGPVQELDRPLASPSVHGRSVAFIRQPIYDTARNSYIRMTWSPHTVTTPDVRDRPPWRGTAPHRRRGGRGPGRVAGLVTARHSPVPDPDGRPPRRSKITGGLAAVACAVCCVAPLLVVAGVLTSAGAAVLQRSLLAVAAGLGALALGMWWWHRHRATRRLPSHPDCDGSCSCGGGTDSG